MIDDETQIITEDEEATESQETQAEQEAETQTQPPQFDTRTKEQEERERAIYLQAQSDLLHRQDEERQLNLRQQTSQDSYRQKLEQIAELRLTDPVIAEEMAQELAQERAETKVRAQFGGAIASAGVASAVEDVDVKFADAPEEVKPFLRAAVKELGLQNEIPTQFVQAVKDMGYGKAVQAGAIGKPPVKRTVAATGAETTTFTNASVPADIAGDAAEFERHFGAAARDVALKEAGYR